MIDSMKRHLLQCSLLWLSFGVCAAPVSAQSSGYALTASPTTVPPGSTIAVSWKAPSNHAATDWIGLFQVGHNDSDASVVSWQYVPRMASGTMSFKSPNVLTSRQYELRYFLDNGFTRTATSNPITVTLSATSSTSSTLYTLSAAPGTVAPGTTISVTWKAPSNHVPTDWIGLFKVGHSDSDASVVAWQYVPGGASGTMAFKAPNVSTSSMYEMRYFLDNGFMRTATSNPVTVALQSTQSSSTTTGGGTTSTTTTQPSTGTSTNSSTSTSTSTTPTTTPTSTTSAGTSPCPNGQQIAFPGAEGFGRCAQGGRGGRVIKVTNLNDSGPGSLRHCAQDEIGPRICVFTVSGTIKLNTYDITVTNDYLTIDGATAPGGGIALKDGGLMIKANHVIVRNLRVRPGLAALLQRGVNVNGIGVLSNEGVPVHDVIVDHCSVGWGSDDLLYAIFGSNNVTFQWIIMSEALECSQCGGKGLLIDRAGHVTVHHSLYAHTYIRWPEISKGELDFVNNVAYNSNGIATQIFPIYGEIHTNFVGNYFKDGPNAYPQNLGYTDIRTMGGQTYSAASGIFVQNNLGRYYGANGTQYGVASPDSAIIWGDNGGIPIQSQRYPFPQVTTTDAMTAYNHVLDRAGAFPRDNVDTRVINDVRSGSGRWIVDPSEVGGWPTLVSDTPPADSDQDGMPNSWELSHGLNPNNPSDGPLDSNGDGFTNVEEYLNSLTPPAL